MSNWNTYLQIIEDNKKELYRSTLKAFAHSHHHTRSSVLKPQEPDYIASLTSYGIPEMAAEWKSILAPYGIATSVVSIFCHGRPIVSHKLSGTNPEIGDLLIVHVHHPRKGKSRRTALLLQAKMLDDVTVEIKKDDHQWLLYRHWPNFDFVKPRIRGINIDVKPKKAHRGAQYLLVDDHQYMGPFSCVYSTSEVANTLIPEQSLSQVVFKLLSFKEGKAFFGRKASMQRLDWSRLIWTLMEKSTGKNFRRINSGIHSEPRSHVSNPGGMSGLFAYLTSNSGTRHHSFLSEIFGAEKWGQIDQFDGGYFESEEENGISIVVIETSHIGEEDSVPVMKRGD
ncbi:hypothetical protein [Paenibacillus xylanexedens]|uniref:hypothetical protein n=1 Tax=Paenibacillus sp. FSL R7-0272 TaxID=2921679 RepID=UPI0012B9C17F|nr:hypothetical protein [Paenibacillus xylanexedens]